MVDSTTSDDVLLRFDDPGSNRALILEDDGRVAYAYLLNNEEPVSDVWLYNVTDTPDEVDWRNQSEMPFLNPKRLCKNEPIRRLSEMSAVQCSWFDKGVEVRVNGVLLARLEEGVRPGWSRLASQPGPLARPLAESHG